MKRWGTEGALGAAVCLGAFVIGMIILGIIKYNG